MRLKWWVMDIPDYYPAGGLNDLEGAFETKEEAEAYAKTLKCGEYLEIFNVEDELDDRIKGLLKGRKNYDFSYRFKDKYKENPPAPCTLD